MKITIKKIFMLTIGLSMTLLAYSQNEIEDFRGLKWGTHLDSVTFDGQPVKLILAMESEEAGDYYVRENEDLTLGTTEVEKIYYAFDEQNRFFKVLIDGESRHNEDMEYILQQKFGKFDGRRRTLTQYHRGWTIGQINVIFTEASSKDWSLLIESNADDFRWEETNTSIPDF